MAVSISSSTRIKCAARKAGHGSAIAVIGRATATMSARLAGSLRSGYMFTGSGVCTDGQTTTCTVTSSRVTPLQTANAVNLCIN